MALISCPECSHQVSELAPACPNCGFPIGEITPDGVVALRNCPDCSGTGTRTEECHHCDGCGYTECGYCNRGRVYGEPCRDCGGSNREVCLSCDGRRSHSWDCETCNHSGQITLRQYEEVLALRKEEAIRQAQQSKEDEKRRLEEQSVAEKLTKLRKRMGKAKGEILLASTSQGSLLITESLYQVDRLKILETYTDQLDALRAHRLQCKYCGELLNWRVRV